MRIAPCAAGFHFSSAQAFGRDVVGELVAAARRGGVVPGLYFSHIDWFDPNMRIDEWNPVGKFCRGLACDPREYNSSSPGWRDFVLRHRAQLLELLTKYGEQVMVSLDMHFPPAFDEAMVDTITLARELAPRTLFRERGIGGIAPQGFGDYYTPEEQFPDKPIDGTWMVIYHGSDFMSYDPVASHYVNGSFIVSHLVDIVAKGGNMEIGYGPDRDGEFHPRQVEALEFAGRWLAVNGEAIYGTRPMPQHWNDTASDFVRYTRSKDGTTVFAIALRPVAALKLACVVADPYATVTLLGFEDPQTLKPYPLAYAEEGGVMTISLPAQASLPQGPAYAFRIPGQPRACGGESVVV